MVQSRFGSRPWRRHGKGLGAILFAAAFGLVASNARASDKHAALLLDVNSGQILYQSAADAPRHPASLAKLMTLYLVFERLEQGKLDYQTKLRVSEHASAAAPSKLDLEPGDEIAVIDAIKVLITKSANDVAVAFAEHIAGSEDRFARLMTEKARQIGMAATTFRNASGLPDDEQVTTARDMATLALRLMDEFPKLYPLFATRSFTYKAETFRNHNSLLFHYKGTDGLKTGYTRASGFNLVASVRRGRKHVLGVVFGGSTAAARNTTMRALINNGLVKGAAEETRRRTVVAAAPPMAKAAPTRSAPAAESRPSFKSSPAAEPGPPSVPTASTTRVELAQVRPVHVGASPPAQGLGEEGASAAPTIAALIERSMRQDAQPERDDLAASALPSTPGPAALQAAPAVRAPTLLSPPRLVRGSPPSTFAEQALTLRRDAPLGEAAGAPAPAWPGGGMTIQIGAFQSVDEAQRRLAWVRQRATAVVGQHEAVTQPVKQGEKLFYRARFAGFDGAAAASACKELRALKVDCLVLRAD
ncbi:MAG TPA: serine hydrolase [Hyphomicrobiaceae bacterium]|nr:serine hydrolase [Hyphomicrobiaceae bacterium]